jgi:ferritin-like protein
VLAIDVAQRAQSWRRCHASGRNAVVRTVCELLQTRQMMSSAIEHYNEIVAATEEVDPVTNDMTIAILHDEERHRRLFEGFLREDQTRERD